MQFKDIIGHSEIKERLIKSVRDNHIAHAQLFSGMSGLGKMQMALAYAQYIHCTNRSIADSCGQCNSCLKYKKFIHPDLHFVFPILNKKGKKDAFCDDYLPEWRLFLTHNDYFDINDWLADIGTENQQANIFTREADEIIKKLSVKSYESPYKIMIIWLPERMREEASNKILKILEEPFDNTFFILVSNDPESLLATIRSRTQQIVFRPIPEFDITSALINRYNVSPDMAPGIAHLSNGNMHKAIDNINISEEKEYYLNLFMQMMRLAYGRKLKEMKLWSEEVAGLGRERQKTFLQYSQRMIRENFILNFRNPSLNYMTLPELNFSQRFSLFVNGSNTEQIMETLELAEAHISQNVNSKMVFFDMALQFIMLLKQN